VHVNLISIQCILNSWIKSTHSIIQTPPTFVEVQNSSPTSPPQPPNPDTVPLDGVGMSFSDPTFCDTFVQQFRACIQLMAESPPNPMKLSQEVTNTHVIAKSQEITKSHSVPPITSSETQQWSDSTMRRGSFMLAKSSSTMVSDGYSSLRSQQSPLPKFSGSIGQRRCVKYRPFHSSDVGTSPRTAA
jgi:hypothetical protein